MPATVYLWNKAPFIRLLISLMSGIILQRQLEFSFSYVLVFLVVFSTTIITYSAFPLRIKYKFSFVNGSSIKLWFLFMGMGLVWLKDIRHHSNWIGHYYKEGDHLMVTIEEPLIEKSNSYKALGSVVCLYDKNKIRPLEGKIMLYFKKEPGTNTLSYGVQVIFNKPPQEIKNADNPGSFN